MTHDLTRKPLDQWSSEDVTTAAGSGLPKTYRVARSMLEDHDYFQGGALWIGERAEAGLAPEQLRRIKNVFVPDPLLEEIRENRTNGLLQREATIAFDSTKPAKEETTEQDARVTEVLSALAKWWDTKKFWAKAREAFGHTCYSRRSALRIWIPDINLTETTTEQGRAGKALPPASTLEEALDRIEIEAPPPDTAGRFTLASQREVAVVLMDDETDRRAELWSVEISPTGAKQTVVRIPGKRTFFPAQVETVSYDLGGRLPVVEIKTSELVTDPIIKQQSLLNLSSTILECVLEKAGFPERYLLNVEAPGLWLPYPPEGVPIDQVDISKDSAGNTIYRHHRPWKFGFSAVAELIGAKTLQATPTGNIEALATPSVQRFDPVDPTYVKTAREMIRNTIYKNCRQGHYATDSTAEASGVAYQQHRAQFEADLVTLKGGVESAVRDAIEVVLAYAGLMHAETRTFLDDFRVVVTVHVTSGPVTPAEMQETRANRDARLLSNATAMGRIGIEDIGAEQVAVESDPGNLAAKWTAVATAISALTGIDGMTSAAAAALLGLSPEEIDVFRTGEAPVAPTAPPTLTAA